MPHRVIPFDWYKAILAFTKSANPALPPQMLITQFSAPNLTFHIQIHCYMRVPAEVVSACLISFLDYESRQRYFAGIREAVRNVKFARKYIDRILELEKQFATLQSKSFQSNAPRNSKN